MTPKRISFGVFLLAEATAEEVTTTLPDSEADPPSSQAVLESPSVEEEPSGETGEEAPGTGAEERSADSYALDELDQLYHEGKLSQPGLVDRRERLRQAEGDRQREYERATAQMRADEEQRFQELTTLGQTTRQAIREAITTEINAANAIGREVDLDLIAERVESHLGNLESRTGEIHLAPHERGLREALLRHVGDTPQNRRAVAAMAVPQLITAIYREAYWLGQKAPPSADHVVKTKKEYEADLAKAKRAVIEEMQAANPGWSPPRSDGRRNAAPTFTSIYDASSAFNNNEISREEYGKWRDHFSNQKDT